MTPEGRTKRKINAVLKRYAGRIYVHMPVPSGFGRQTLDYLCVFRGFGFAIEAKRPGGVPTPRQEETIADIQAADGRVFVIDDDTSELEAWLAAVDQSTQCLRNTPLQ